MKKITDYSFVSQENGNALFETLFLPGWCLDKIKLDLQVDNMLIEIKDLKKFIKYKHCS